MPSEQGETLIQTAVTRRVRPRRVTAGVRGSHRDPDLLEWAPVIGRSLVVEEPGAVGLLEGEVHLEPAPVRAAGIGPAALVTVDAEPVREARRMVRVPPRLMRTVLPAPGDALEPRERPIGERARGARRRAAEHHRLPVPHVRLRAANVASPTGCSPQFPTRRRVPR